MLCATGLCAEVQGEDKRFRYIEDIYTPEGGSENPPPDDEEGEEQLQANQTRLGSPQVEEGVEKPTPTVGHIYCDGCGKKGRSVKQWNNFMKLCYECRSALEAQH